MKPIHVMVAAALVGFGSCTPENDGSGTTRPPGSTVPPVETQAPNSTYKPVVEGQTRVSGVITAARYKFTVLTTALSAPWGVVSLPDGRMLVTERDGQLRIVSTTGAVSQPITGVPSVNSGGQGGLLGLCLDPDFATNRMVYLSFSEPGNLTAIAKGKLSANDGALEGVTVIYRATPAYSGINHYGGRLVFDRTKNLLISTGERSDLVTRPQAQSVTSSLGKIIRIDRNGQPASDNPIFSEPNARPELYSIGHRNPQGLAINPATGDLWNSEHGPKGGDEINMVQAGFNYGWPTITFGLEYDGKPVGAGIQQQGGLQQPVYYWDPVVSPSGMTFYTGDRMPEWQNNLFIGSLTGKHIIRLIIVSNKVVAEERLLSNEGQRFRDITQGSDGALYAITDEGRLYKIDRE